MSQHSPRSRLTSWVRKWFTPRRPRPIRRKLLLELEALEPRVVPDGNSPLRVSGGVTLQATAGVEIQDVLVATVTGGEPAPQGYNYSAWIDWGDGGSSGGQVNGSALPYAVTGSHTYRSPGIYQVVTTVHHWMNGEWDTGYSLVIVAPAPLDAPPARSFSAHSGTPYHSTESDRLVPNGGSSGWQMPEPGLVRGPQHGTLTLAPDGSFTYTADRAYKGPDSFDYVLVADGVISASATVAITVYNTAPVLANRTYDVRNGTTLSVSGSDATGILAGASDADGDRLTVHLLSSPEHGSLMVSEDGSFTYVPEPAFTGTDSFQVVAFDGTDTSAPATVTIQVNPPDWSATDQTFSVHAGAALNGHLTADLDVWPAGLRFHQVSDVSGGWLDFQPDGSFRYTSRPGFVGVDSFSFRLYANGFFSAPATVSILVTN